MTVQMAPPANESPTPWNWVRKNLFSTWYNSILTIACLIGIAQGFKVFFTWATTQAQWAVVHDNLTVLFAGRFPLESIWRLWLILYIIALLSGLIWGTQLPAQPWSPSVLIIFGITIALIALSPIGLVPRLLLWGQVILVALGYWLGRQMPHLFSRWLPLVSIISLPIIFWLIRGGWGLKAVETNDWSGLLLTLFAAVVSMVLSFPLGILAALGRQSQLPVVRWFSILCIEVFRGLPLVGVLFLALVMLPLVLPPELSQQDQLLRAIAGLTLFSAAYLAEVVRGGLQAIPKGQLEAARALGLSPPLVIALVLLPQALRTVVPALVGEFVGIFKDTTILSVFGLVELLGISASILANPQYIGRYAEVYLFVGVIYWIFCYSMSAASQRLETSSDVSQR